MSTASTEACSQHVPIDQDQYPQFLDAVAAQLSCTAGPLFTTDAADLYEAFVDALPAERQQRYRCHHCRQFVTQYGGLATLGPDGSLHPWMWPAAGYPGLFAAPSRLLHARVSRAKITGVFLSARPMWGVAENRSARTGILWRHLAFQPPAALIFQGGPLTSADQTRAEKLQEFQMLQRSLAEFPLDLAIRAMTLLKSGNLFRSEKADALAQWFVELHERRNAVPPGRRDNVVWLAAATAPPGFAHLRAGMLGTLLEDLQADLPFEVVQDKWAAKMDPLRYMRPQAAPSAGNIAAAEQAIATLQSAGALERRFARLDEVQAIWQPVPPAQRNPHAGGGVFAHLVPKGQAAREVVQPAVTMTFEKFRREVLPEATAIEALVPAHGHFVALITAVRADAPPILQWDTEAQRNPVNWYVYPSGSDASQWGLQPGWVRVTALTLMPQLWNPERDHGQHGKGVFVLLEGCRDQGAAGLALFPEVLKAEYRPFRATIEAFSRTGKLAGRDEASACGLDLRAGSTWRQQLRVTDHRNIITLYLLDRWD